MVNIKSITRNTTCIDLFSSDELYYCCNKCSKLLDPLSIRKPKKQIDNRKISLRKKCEQQWDSRYAATASRVLRHKEVCEKLDLPLDFIVQDDYKYTKETNEGKPCTGKKPSQPEQTIK